MDPKLGEQLACVAHAIAKHFEEEEARAMTPATEQALIKIARTHTEKSWACGPKNAYRQTLVDLAVENLIANVETANGSKAVRDILAYEFKQRARTGSSVLRHLSARLKAEVLRDVWRHHVEPRQKEGWPRQQNFEPVK